MFDVMEVDFGEAGRRPGADATKGGEWKGVE